MSAPSNTAPAPSETDEILKRALDGARLTAGEITKLFECNDITLLGNVATRLYQKRTGRDDGTVTYIVDRNINYTNICVTDCSFCAFYRKEGAEDAYVLPFETIAQKIEEVMAVGGVQILLQGGHDAHLKIDYYEDLFQKIKTSSKSTCTHFRRRKSCTSAKCHNFLSKKPFNA